MVVCVMHEVLASYAFVDVVTVGSMEMTVMDVVDVVFVRDRDVATAGLMPMCMLSVREMCS
jgi:hypothetical protein